MSGGVRRTWWAILLIGCSMQGVEPTPFLGVPPRSILVAPIDNRSGQLGLADAFIAALPAQLEDRGYYVYPTDTGLSWLRGQETTVESFISVGREFQLDAVLVVSIRSWNAVFGRVLESLNYDVGYEILSALDGRLIWEYQASGGYQRQLEPISMEGRYRGPSFEPNGVDFSENFRFQNNAEIASALSRMVFQHLPVAPDPQ